LFVFSSFNNKSFFWIWDIFLSLFFHFFSKKWKLKFWPNTLWRPENYLFLNFQKFTFFTFFFAKKKCVFWKKWKKYIFFVFFWFFVFLWFLVDFIKVMVNNLIKWNKFNKFKNTFFWKKHEKTWFLKSLFFKKKVTFCSVVKKHDFFFFRFFRLFTGCSDFFFHFKKGVSVFFTFFQNLSVFFVFFLFLKIFSVLEKIWIHFC